jgi:hypothetical protein
MYTDLHSIWSTICPKRFVHSFTKLLHSLILSLAETLLVAYFPVQPVFHGKITCNKWSVYVQVVAKGCCVHYIATRHAENMFWDRSIFSCYVILLSKLCWLWWFGHCASKQQNLHMVSKYAKASLALIHTTRVVCKPHFTAEGEVHIDHTYKKSD